MKGFNTKLSHRIVASILVVVFVVPFLGAQAMGTSLFSNRQQAETEGEMQLANQIANISGASTDKILSLRADGFSWNTILSTVGSNDSTYSYEDETTQEAMMMIESLVMNLEEIDRYNQNYIEMPNIEANIKDPTTTGESDELEEEIKACQMILKNMDQELLLFAMFELEERLESKAKVIDEYLSSLQLSIDFSLALEDYDAYLEEKQNAMDMTTLLDTHRISILCVEIIQKGNESMSEQYITTDENNGEDSLIDVIHTPVIDNQVLSPNEQLEEELERMNPND